MLSRELSEFLLELSIAIHQHGIYPPGHPSLEPAAILATDRVTYVLRERGTLSLGAAKDQLVMHVCDVYDALRTNRPYRTMVCQEGVGIHRGKIWDRIRRSHGPRIYGHDGPMGTSTLHADETSPATQNSAASSEPVTRLSE